MIINITVSISIYYQYIVEIPRRLNTYNIIDEETKNDFDLIRNTRRKYLHLWSQDHNSLPSDARAVYNSAVFLVVKAIGQEIRDGKLLINPALVKYLARTGAYEPSEDER